jgi:phenylalanyl-tRNA synthetase alpha chain
MKYKGFIKNKFCQFTKNIPISIEEKIGRNIYKVNNHPLGIIKNKMINFFKDDNIIKSKYSSNANFSVFEDFHPKVSLEQNFYNLLVEKNHEVVSPKNTYYWDENNVLRTHMTAHDFELIKSGEQAFISIGDVYRRDSIDSTHYPVFHQIDGVRVFDGENITTDYTIQELKFVLEALNKYLFGDVRFRWIEAYFPFTDPSYELEIFFNDKWLEVLGCGILRDPIIDNAGLDSKKSKAWAFGIGIERLAMILFDIKDIRTFWSKDERFLMQSKI